METDWSVAAAAGDPAIEVEWSDPATGRRWVSLRLPAAEQARLIAGLPEVHDAPVLAKVLAALNANEGVLLTSKCDRWRMDADELEETAEILDAPVQPAGVASYIDVLMAHAVPMADFLLHEEWVRGAARRCAALDLQDARLELVVRPALHSGEWGYGVTMYCYAVAANDSLAEAAWARAIEQSTPLVIAAANVLFATPDEMRVENAPDGSS